MSSLRKKRLEEQFRRDITEIIMKEIKDPRIGFASITYVQLSKDMSFAKVGVSIMGNPREIRKTYEGLKSAAGYIQHLLSKRLTIRHTPKLSFKLDSSISDGVEMVDFLNKLEEKEGLVEQEKDILQEDE